MIHFIVNVLSGKKKGQRTINTVSRYCFKHGIAFTTHVTQRKGHATEIADSLCQSGAQTIVAVGGDGTFSETLNGISTPETTALGFIPAGRGNDYARSAGLSLKPITALSAILRGETIQSDYLTIGQKRCLNVTGTGLDVEVLERVEQKKKSYLSSLLYCLYHFDPYDLVVTANGETTRHSCIMAGACNGGYIGGGIHVSPASKVSDGKLNLVIVRIPKNGRILPALFKFKKGKHLGAEYTSHLECDEVTVLPGEGKSYPIQIDGEIFYDYPLTCKIVKGGLKTFRP